jgi:glutamate synthase domain-containing protein 3
MQAHFAECFWDSNSGTLGAGIYIGGGEVLVENSTLSNQLADLHGGAFFLSGRYTKVDRLILCYSVNLTTLTVSFMFKGNFQ